MSFLVLMLTIILEKLSHIRSEIQKDSWWFALQTRCTVLFTKTPWLALFLSLAVALVPLSIIFYFSSSIFYGLLLLPLHLVIVLYSIGRTDIKKNLGSFRDAWRRQDKTGAMLSAQRDLEIYVEHDKDLFIAVQQYMSWKAYQGFFSVIFYYCLFGPIVALTYRLLVLTAEQSRHPQLAEKARFLLHSLDWIPVRLLGLTFALMGNFSAVSKNIMHNILSIEISAASYIGQSSRAAADINDNQQIDVLDQLWQLLVRSAMFWYIVVAFFTLYSW
ncbi:regulatory signaling modulator protein AmpE [Pseudomonas sp. F1_0610]|uniref:regulatory signaling modulator protein AmpE n=1 Tax=Pseudomonas sp. F1_0610 TaxID=3114284 RepID=UPI0039C460DA